MVYEYKCNQCKGMYESPSPTKNIKCRTIDCTGEVIRNWKSVSLLRQNIRAVPRGDG